MLTSRKRKILSIMLSMSMLTMTAAPLQYAYAKENPSSTLDYADPTIFFGSDVHERREGMDKEVEDWGNDKGEKARDSVKSGQPDRENITQKIDEASQAGSSANQQGIADIQAQQAAFSAGSGGPEQPELGSETDADQSIKDAVTGAKLPVQKLENVYLDENGKIVRRGSDDDGSGSASGDSLVEMNKAVMQAAREQQKNQTSSDASRSYNTQDANGNEITLVKNACYQSTEPKCLVNYQYSYTDDDGKYHQTTVPLNTLEYLASDSSRVTSDMIEQARRQEAFTDATMSGINGGEITADPVGAMTSAVRTGIASGMEPSEAMLAGMLAASAHEDGIRDMQAIQEAMANFKKIQDAKDAVSFSKAEDAQQKAGVLNVPQNKRFTVRLNPTVPVVGGGEDIKVTLVTKSGKPNDESKYTVHIRIKNQETGKVETIQVLENTPAIVEKGSWGTKPGTRTVQVIYSFKDKAQREKYIFSYTVGQLSTAILPNGQAVTNSVTALMGNADILNYGISGQAVAGRISAVKFAEGTCYMQMTDSKGTDPRYPSVVVASSKIPESECTDEQMVNRYASMESVSSQYDADGRYIFVDDSDSDGFRLMSEADYDAMENRIAKETQDKGNEWDNKTLRVAEDGTIYESLPGELGVNFLNLSAGTNNNVNIGVSVQPDGSYHFSKADGTPYSDEELEAKGLDVSTISIGLDPASNMLYAYDTATGKLLSNSFSSNDTSVLSRMVVPDDELAGVDTSRTLAGQNIIAGAGDTATPGTVLSSMFSSITNAGKNVVSIIGNSALISSGMFASLGTAAVGSTTSLSTPTQSAAEQAAIQACSGLAADRCSEYMKLAMED